MEDTICLTTKELLDHLKISQSTLTKMLNEDPDFKRYKVGSTWRYDLNEVLKKLKGEDK